MCRRDEEKLLHHITHCYPYTTSYIAVVVTLILILAIAEAMT